MRRQLHWLTICAAMGAVTLPGACLLLPAVANAGEKSISGPSKDTATSADGFGDMQSSVESYSVDSAETAVGGVETKTTSRARPDQSNARGAVERGEVRPYGWFLKTIKKAAPGDIVKVRLRKRTASLWTYDVTVLNKSGRYVQLSLNAATGAIISKKNR